MSVLRFHRFHHYLILYGIFAGLSPAHWGDVHAQTATHEFESANPLPAQLVPEVPAQIEQSGARQAIPALSAGDWPPSSVPSSDQMAQQIERHIRARQWHELEALLPDYAKHPQADPLLVLYARGALLRQQQQYAAAIAAFSALLQAQPQLLYVRLDLAIMQMEDKQFFDAMANFARLLDAPQAPAPLKQLAHAWQTRLGKVYAPEFSINASYARNDNVNQASSERIISLGGLDFVKNPDSLPKVGHGVHYGVGLRKSLPLRGRHGLSLDLAYHGVYYYDQKDYNERTLRLSPAYRYQSYHQWFKIGPVLEKNWLGGAPYGTRAGLHAEWGRRLSARNHLIPVLSYTNKRYHAPALYRYEGVEYRSGATWLHQLNPRTTLWLGANIRRDLLRDVRESSKNLSLRAGGMLRMQNGMTVQANLQAGHRHFDAPHALFRFTRRDREHAVSLSLWHSSLSFLGITPKLVYNHRSIRSNISSLYSRTSRGFMIETADIRF